MTFDVGDAYLEWVGPSDVLRIEAWGEDALRVRAARDAVRDDLPGALLPWEGPAAEVTVDDGVARVSSGRLCAEVDERGLIRFRRGDTEVLAEHPARFWWPGPRFFTADRLEQRFQAYDEERLYGLGQQVHGRLDQKGCVIDLVQRNGEVSIPFLLSSRGYGLLWNNPAAGRVELGAEATRWVAEGGARQIDYWITAGDRPAEILRRYADATGHAPMLPEWAAGFWQSKLRYRDQAELLEVAREYRRRELPLSVIVCDFFHWPAMGTWRFDPADWPDPAGMVAALEEMGVRLAVSIWPTVNPATEPFDAMRRAGYLVATTDGSRAEQEWPEKGEKPWVKMAYHDASNPDARRFLWERVREGYHRHGVRVWWLDACEPDFSAELVETAQYAAGPGRRVGNAYPLWHAQGFYEGMREAGETDIVLLIRSAWAGSQRYGTLLWSGDIPTTFESLATQVKAGLNVALSGIPWWTTDIGGFHGGDPDDPQYRELMVRWFQYGVFCPVTRLHGHREPREPFSATMTAGPNEIWSYGEEAYQILADQLRLRERLTPYLLRQMEVAHREGVPPMRPLFVEFPDDPRSWEVDDQFLLGPEILVAPVTAYGVRKRPVYLPAGTGWRDAWTGESHDGGVSLAADTPLDRIPVYLRDGSDVRLAEA